MTKVLEKALFSKNGYISPIFNLKMAIFGYVAQNNIRKLIVQFGEKISSRSIFFTFSKSKNGPNSAILDPMMPIFDNVHKINVTKLPVKFYNNNCNGSIFLIFCDTKNRPYLGNYNR